MIHLNKISVGQGPYVYRWQASWHYPRNKHRTKYNKPVPELFKSLFFGFSSTFICFTIYNLCISTYTWNGDPEKCIQIHKRIKPYECSFYTKSHKSLEFNPQRSNMTPVNSFIPTCCQHSLSWWTHPPRLTVNTLSWDIHINCT